MMIIQNEITRVKNSIGITTTVLENVERVVSPNKRTVMYHLKMAISHLEKAIEEMKKG